MALHGSLAPPGAASLHSIEEECSDGPLISKFMQEACRACHTLRAVVHISATCTLCLRLIIRLCAGACARALRRDSTVDKHDSFTGHTHLLCGKQMYALYQL